MSHRRARRNPAALSHHALRRMVGMIALLLPIVLAVGTVLLNLAGPRHALPQPVIQRSISDYYYTPMGDCLVGSLCVIAAFLMCSRGYDLHDEIVGYFAGAFTLGVALFPSVNPRGIGLTPLRVDVGFVHTGFATLMFLTLAYLCLVQFRKCSPEGVRTRRKQYRDRIYLICGAIIVACSAVMVSLTIKPVGKMLGPIHPLFVSETLSLFAFGVAWITKGEGLLKDPCRDHAEHTEGPETKAL